MDSVNRIPCVDLEMTQQLAHASSLPISVISHDQNAQRITTGRSRNATLSPLAPSEAQGEALHLEDLQAPLRRGSLARTGSWVLKEAPSAVDLK